MRLNGEREVVIQSQFSIARRQAAGSPVLPRFRSSIPPRPGFAEDGDFRVVVQFAKKLQTFVIPKPGLSARNLLFFNSGKADSSRDSAALRNDKSSNFKLHHYRFRDFITKSKAPPSFA